MAKKSIDALAEQAGARQNEKVLGGNSALLVFQIILDLIDTVPMEFSPNRRYKVGQWAIWEGRLVQCFIATEKGHTPKTHRESWTDNTVGDVTQLVPNGPNLPVLADALREFVEGNQGEGGSSPLADENVPGISRRSTLEALLTGVNNADHVTPYLLSKFGEAFLQVIVNLVEEAKNSGVSIPKLSQVTKNGGNETDDQILANRFTRFFFEGVPEVQQTYFPMVMRREIDPAGRSVMPDDYTSWDRFMGAMLDRAEVLTLNHAFIRITEGALDGFVYEFAERLKRLSPETIQSVANRGNSFSGTIKSVDFCLPDKPVHNQGRGFAVLFPVNATELFIVEMRKETAATEIVNNLTVEARQALAAQLAPYLNISSAKTVTDFEIVGDDSVDEGQVKLYTPRAIFSDGSTGVLPDGYTWSPADSFNVPTAQLAPLPDNVQGNTFPVVLQLTFQIPGQAQPTTKTKAVIRRDTTPVPVSTNGIAVRLSYNPATLLLEVEVAPGGQPFFHRYARKDGVALVGSNPDGVPLESGTWFGFGELPNQGTYTHQGRFGKKADGTGGIPPSVVVVLSLRRETDGVIFTVEYQTPSVADGVVTRRQVCTAAASSVVPAPVFNNSLPSLPAMTEGQQYNVSIPKTAVTPAPGYSIAQIFVTGVPSYLAYAQLNENNPDALQLYGIPPDGALSPTVRVTWAQADGQTVSFDYPIQVLDVTAPPPVVPPVVSGEDESGQELTGYWQGTEGTSNAPTLAKVVAGFWYGSLQAVEQNGPSLISNFFVGIQNAQATPNLPQLGFQSDSGAITWINLNLLNHTTYNTTHHFKHEFGPVVQAGQTPDLINYYVRASPSSQAIKIYARNAHSKSTIGDAIIYPAP